MADKDPAVKFQDALQVDLRKLVKTGNPTADIFKEVIEERTKAKQAKQKEKATEWINKACELQEQADKLESEFNKNKKKLSEELGKIVNQITQALSGGGGSAPATDAPAADAPAADAPATT